MIKNGSISEQLELQNPIFTNEKKKDLFQFGEKGNNIPFNLGIRKDNIHFFNQEDHNRESSLLFIFSLENDSNYDATLTKELQVQKRKNKKSRRL